MAEERPAGTGPLSLVVFSGTFERVHYALAIAAAALACDRPVTLFFTMEAARALGRADGDGRPGWAALGCDRDGMTPLETDAGFRARGVAGYEELLAACVALGAGIMVCEMGLRAIGLDPAALREDVPTRPGGLVTFLAGIGDGGATLFI